MIEQKPIKSVMCGVDSVPLQSVSVAVKASHFVAHYELLQTYKNNEDCPIEAIYSFPLPESCAVSAFEVDIDGKKIVGRVLKHEEAKEEYDAAMAKGDGAFMVAQDRPNVFTANVGNLLPGQVAIVKLSYVCELTQSGDSVSLTIPSTISPRYINADWDSGASQSADGPQSSVLAQSDRRR